MGLETWRIEKMVPVKQDDAMCDGKLFSGDSYIVLSTTLKGSALVWHIHFWLGEETSQVRWLPRKTGLDLCAIFCARLCSLTVGVPPCVSGGRPQAAHVGSACL